MVHIPHTSRHIHACTQVFFLQHKTFFEQIPVAQPDSLLIQSHKESAHCDSSRQVRFTIVTRGCYRRALTDGRVEKSLEIYKDLLFYRHTWHTLHSATFFKSSYATLQFAFPCRGLTIQKQTYNIPLIIHSCFPPLGMIRSHSAAGSF